jgi:hypothetical protein
MKRLLTVLVSVLWLLLVALPAHADPKLLTFGTGQVSIEGDVVTIVNGPGDYAGVYLASRSKSAKPLAAVMFSFRSLGDVTGGAPRFSIPIDDPATEPSLDGYAFIDAANCGGTSGGDTRVATNNADCAVFLNVGGSWSNWNAFAAANPAFRIAPGYIPFIIADGTPAPGATYVVTDIVLR